MAVPPTIGNRIAPPTFITFFVLLFAGIVVGLATMERARAIMSGFDDAAAVSCLAAFRNFAIKLRPCAGQRARMMRTAPCY